MSMLEPARYRNKETQSGTGMLRYRTKLMNADAGDIGLDADAQLIISRQNGRKLGTDFPHPFPHVYIAWPCSYLR